MSLAHFPANATTLVACFAARLAATPEQPLVTWLDAAGRPALTWSFALASERAQGVAAVLLASGLRPGDRALLVFIPSLEFVAAMLGCLIAGVVPVIAQPPHPLKLREELPGLWAVAADSGARVVLADVAYAAVRQAPGFQEAAPPLPWLVTNGLRAEAPRACHVAKPDELAVLQYTSGSTGSPKGVRITHGNLFAEAQANALALGLHPGVRSLIWLPQHHSFALVNFITSAFAGNGHLHLLAPLAFMERPATWLDALSHTRATHSAAPAFGLAVALRGTTPEQRAAWDLSALEAIVCAGEALAPELLAGFNAAFAASGLRPGVVRPAFGLTEHAVSVTIGSGRTLELDREALAVGRVRPAPDAARALRLVGAGVLAKPGARLRIVDPETVWPCPPDRVGEIWVDSPTKADGYHGQPELSREAFEARVADPEDPRGYLRTGDMGFVHEGELYVTGRIKELVILKGKNHHPADLEAGLAAAYAGLVPGGLAAFAYPGEGGESLGIVAELAGLEATAEDARAAAEAIRARLLHVHHVAAGWVLVGRPGLLPRTGSGKPQRLRCRERMIAGSLLQAPEALYLARFESGSTGRGISLAALQQALVDELDLTTPPPPETPLAALGIDSVRGMRLLGHLETLCGRQLDSLAFYEHATIAALAAALAGGSEAEAPEPAASAAATGDWFVPLNAPASPRLRLFCFAHAGGDAGLFARWPDALPADVEMLAMALPGRGERAGEAPCEEFAALLAGLVGAIAPLLDRPYAFFGHSMGALVAFELARALRRQGLVAPAWLFLSSFPAPEASQGPRLVTERELVESGEWLGPYTRQDVALFAAWQPPVEPPLASPLTVWGGEQDPLVGREALAGWQRQTIGAFEQRMVPGGHAHPFHAPATLLAALRERLAVV